MGNIAEKWELKSGWQIWRFAQMAVSANDQIDDPSKANINYMEVQNEQTLKLVEQFNREVLDIKLIGVTH